MRTKYDLLLLDPPWEYDNKQQNDPARGGITYDTLSMQDMYNIPVGNIANENSILVCWVTFPKLMDEYYEKYNPLAIIRKRGFRPVTTLFVWVKLRKGVTVCSDDLNAPGDLYLLHPSNFYSGLGRYTNSNAEIAIVARKGKMLPRVNKNVKQLIFAPIGNHSEKPHEQYTRLYDLFGDVKRIELFARKQNAPPSGWDATGLEFDGVDIRNFVKEYEHAH